METGQRKNMVVGTKRNMLVGGQKRNSKNGDQKKNSIDGGSQKNGNDEGRQKNGNDGGQQKKNSEGGQKKKIDPKIDVAILQQPLQVSMRGVQMILKCMNDGTEEIKSLLLKECDVIFECKVCRSMFRGLPNLLSHKRSFCMKPYVDKRTDFPREKPSDTSYVEPTEPDPEYAESEDEVTVAEVRARRGRIRDPILLSLSRNFVEPENPPDGPLPINRITDILPQNVKISSDLSPHKLQQLNSSRLSVDLSPLKNNTATLKELTSASLGSISKVVDGLNKKLCPDDQSNGNGEDDCCSSSSVSSSVESPMKSPNTQIDMLRAMKNVDLRRNRCLQCRKSFLQWQYLLSHMRTKHSSERKLYKCVLCETVFQYTRSIGRHLVRRHKKSPKEIADLVRLIREQPITVKSEGAVKTTQAADKLKAKNNAGLFQTRFSLITCRMCNKVFGKKTTRDNHEKSCYKRITFDNSGEPAITKRGRGRPRKSPVAILKPGVNSPVAVSPPNRPGNLQNRFPSPVAQPNRRKAGRPCKVIQNVEESSDSSSDENDEEEGEIRMPKVNGKDVQSPVVRRRGRPSLNRQTSSKSGSDGENKARASGQANKGRPQTKPDSPSMILVAPVKKDPSTSPGKVKRTGYTERFEDIAQPYMDSKGLKCLICSQIFLLKPTLITHVCSMHLQMRRFKCTFCGWKALFKSEVVIHLRHKHHQETGTKVKDKLLCYVESL